VRLLRGLAAAVAATSLAAFSHVAAGGPSPDGAIVVLSLALSGLVCTALAGRSLSLWRLSTSVVLSQSLFHGLFSLGSSTHATAPTPMSAGHAGHTAQAMMDHATATGGMDHSSPVMWLGHAIAAVLTIAVLRHGEVTALRLIQALGLKMIPFLPLFQPLAVTPGAPFDPAGWPVRALRNLGVPLLVMRHRGPPLLPVVS
jgi:hypothetical protein